MSEPERAVLEQLERDYQTHCGECFMGMLEHCTGGTAPNGQPCATTPAERIAYLLNVAQRLVNQRTALEAENARLRETLKAAAAMYGAVAQDAADETARHRRTLDRASPVLEAAREWNRVYRLKKPNKLPLLHATGKALADAITEYDNPH